MTEKTFEILKEIFGDRYNEVELRDIIQDYERLKDVTVKVVLKGAKKVKTTFKAAKEGIQKLTDNIIKRREDKEQRLSTEINIINEQQKKAENRLREIEEYKAQGIMNERRFELIKRGIEDILTRLEKKKIKLQEQLNPKFALGNTLRKYKRKLEDRAFAETAGRMIREEVNRLDAELRGVGSGGSNAEFNRQNEVEERDRLHQEALKENAEMDRQNEVEERDRLHQEALKENAEFNRQKEVAERDRLHQEALKENAEMDRQKEVEERDRLHQEALKENAEMDRQKEVAARDRLHQEALKENAEFNRQKETKKNPTIILPPSYRTNTPIVEEKAGYKISDYRAVTQLDNELKQTSSPNKGSFVNYEDLNRRADEIQSIISNFIEGAKKISSENENLKKEINEVKDLGVSKEKLDNQQRTIDIAKRVLASEQAKLDVERQRLEQENQNLKQGQERLNQLLNLLENEVKALGNVDMKQQLNSTQGYTKKK